MSGWLESLFGKPQSWYDRIGRDQAEISALLAEVNAIGRSLWDGVQSAIAGAIRDGGYVPVERFTGFAWTTEDLIAQAKVLLITGKGALPTDPEIQTAESRIALYRSMVEYAKTVLPEISAMVQAEGDATRAAVEGSRLLSPAAVGIETFQAELDRRAKSLGGGAASTLLVLAVAFIAATALSGRRR